MGGASDGIVVCGAVNAESGTGAIDWSASSLVRFGEGEVGRPVPFQRRLAAEGDWRVRGTRAAGAQWPIRRRFVRWGGNFVPCDVVKSNNGPSAIHVDNAGGMLLTTVAMPGSRVHRREGQWRRIHRR